MRIAMLNDMEMAQQLGVFVRSREFSDLSSASLELLKIRILDTLGCAFGAIGQGPLIVTPLQVANMMAAVANGGKVFQPHVVRYVDRVQNDGSYRRFRVPTRVPRSP